MKGIIVVNPYLVPKESISQANRLKEEFNKLDVKVDIVSNGFIKSGIYENAVTTDYEGVDFAVYLDKDKYFSKVLEEKGIRLFNSHFSIRLCDDKGETYLALANKGINIPDTILGELCYSKDLPDIEGLAKDIGKRLSFPLVVKESFGSMGKGVYLANDETELKEIIKQVKCKPHLYQKYLPYKKGVDIRIIVIGGKAVACMERKNENDFRSNAALGGKCTAIKPSKEFIDCAEKTAKILGLDYCGVDLLFGENDTPFVCEVNSNAFISGIERATGVNVAKKYAEYIISALK